MNELLVAETATFTREWKHASCRDKLELPFDFYIAQWREAIVPFILELDGSQHFDDTQNGADAFALNRSHDLHKMRWALNRGIPVVRLTSRAVEFFNSSTWQAWIARVRDERIAPLAGRSVNQRKLIVLEDTPRYKQMFAECIESDPELGPFVVFV